MNSSLFLTAVLIVSPQPTSITPKKIKHSLQRMSFFNYFDLRSFHASRSWSNPKLLIWFRRRSMAIFCLMRFPSERWKSRNSNIASASFLIFFQQQRTYFLQTLSIDAPPLWLSDNPIVVYAQTHTSKVVLSHLPEHTSKIGSTSDEHCKCSEALLLISDHGIRELNKKHY